MYPLVDKNKASFRVEILSFPRENICSFVGCPIDKLCSSALKFVILDYDRFSRSEFVADCVILLDEVSLEGEAITKHLSIRKTQPVCFLIEILPIITEIRLLSGITT